MKSIPRWLLSLAILAIFCIVGWFAAAIVALGHDDDSSVETLRSRLGAWDAYTVGLTFLLLGLAGSILILRRAKRGAIIWISLTIAAIILTVVYEMWLTGSLTLAKPAAIIPHTDDSNTPLTASLLNPAGFKER